jgi:hypothetical protein
VPWIFIVLLLTGCTYGFRASAGAEVGPDGRVGAVGRAGFVVGFDQSATVAVSGGASVEGGLGRISLERIGLPEDRSAWIWHAGAGAVLRQHSGATIGGYAGIGRTFLDESADIDQKGEHVLRSVDALGVEVGADVDAEAGGHASLEVVLEILRHRDS